MTAYTNEVELQEALCCAYIDIYYVGEDGSTCKHAFCSARADIRIVEKSTIVVSTLAPCVGGGYDSGLLIIPFERVGLIRTYETVVDRAGFRETLWVRTPDRTWLRFES